MKTVVKTFKDRFAPLVEAGSKLQTVRPTPKRPQDWPEVGDTFSGRQWLGKPYRSKQRLLAEGTIVRVATCAIDDLGSMVVGVYALRPDEKEAFARADGFESFTEMVEWFEAEHGLPFMGIAIFWDLNPALKPQPKKPHDETKGQQTSFDGFGAPEGRNRARRPRKGPRAG